MLEKRGYRPDDEAWPQRGLWKKKRGNRAKVTAANGSDCIVHGFESARRSILALKTDPLKPLLGPHQEASGGPPLALMYASYARKLKLENSK
ncbi:hypothetical protein PIB30_064127, partial [Stylosanthes scabra]|nr:hypothetical protein [Stylosanthes scabra]